MSHTGRQAMFDTAVRGLVVQGRGAYGNSGCFFRTPETRTAPAGLKCAIGQCIKDEFYMREMDTGDLNFAAVLKAVQASGFDIDPNNEEDRAFAQVLQQAHDNVIPEQGNFISAFKRHATELVPLFDLNPTVLTEPTP